MQDELRGGCRLQLQTRPVFTTTSIHVLLKCVELNMLEAGTWFGAAEVGVLGLNPRGLDSVEILGLKSRRLDGVGGIFGHGVGYSAWLTALYGYLR